MQTQGKHANPIKNGEGLVVIPPVMEQYEPLSHRAAHKTFRVAKQRNVFSYTLFLK